MLARWHARAYARTLQLDAAGHSLDNLIGHLCHALRQRHAAIFARAHVMQADKCVGVAEWAEACSVGSRSRLRLRATGRGQSKTTVRRPTRCRRASWQNV